MAKIKFSKIKKIHAMTYTDKVDVVKQGRVKNEDGTTSTGADYTTTKTYECRVSFGENDDIHRRTQFYLTGHLPVKLFMDSTVPIHKGDEVTAYRLDDEGNILAKYFGVVNRPLVFTTHQEVMFADVRIA